jgi:hypothetical protein
MNIWAVIRSKLGLTRYAIAKQMGMRQTKWDNLEIECGRPTLDYLVRLKNLSGLSGNQMFELIEEAGAKPKSRDRKTSKRRGSK